MLDSYTLQRIRSWGVRRSVKCVNILKLISMNTHFGMGVAERIPDQDRHEKALPPVEYVRDKQYFRYMFEGHAHLADEVFSDSAPERLKEHLKSMSVTSGSTGKRDFCFI